MTRAEFSKQILFLGGTYEDVNRLEEEGFRDAKIAHEEMAATMGEAEFNDFCYDIGRDFVWDNMWDLFKLKHPENAETQKRINIWKYLMRNIGSVALCLSHYADANEVFSANDVTWSDIATAQKILEDLKDVCEFANIKVVEC